MGDRIIWIFIKLKNKRTKKEFLFTDKEVINANGIWEVEKLTG